MKNFLITAIMILTLGMFANAQFDMQRSPNNGTEPNPIRPEITNDLSHLGAAYTLGTDPGNLTGNYGRFMQLRLERIFGEYSSISTKLLFFEADGTPAMVDLGNGNVASEIDLLLLEGWAGTLGLDANFSFIIDSAKLLYQLSLSDIIDEKK